MVFRVLSQVLEVRQVGIHLSSDQRLPKRLLKDGRRYLPKRQRLGIRLDRIDPTDLRLFELRYFCDDCTHYDCSQKKCTLGYRAQHTKTEQMRLYELTGQMALCRAIEID